MLTALCLVTLLQWLVQKQHMKHTSLQHFVTVWWLMLCSRSYSPHQQYSVQLSSLDVRGGSHSSTWSQWVYFAYYLGNCLFYHWATVQNFLNSSFILTQTFRMEMRLLPALRKWGSQQKGFCFELKNKTHINISRSRKKKRKDWEIFSTSSQWTSDNRRLVLLEQQGFFFSCHVNFKHNILYFFDISHLFELFLFCFCFIFLFLKCQKLRLFKLYVTNWLHVFTISIYKQTAAKQNLVSTKQLWAFCHQEMFTLRLCRFH